jgi:hypothetical protein
MNDEEIYDPMTGMKLWPIEDFKQQMSAEEYLILKQSLDEITPPRQWVGLTDDEYQTILKEHDGAGLLAFYNLIEAKLKEKNT